MKPLPLPLRKPGPRRQRTGYVLIMVLGALAVASVVAASFAARIDALRQQAGSLAAYADGRLQASNAAAIGLYWMASHDLGPAGFGPPLNPDLRADDRVYRFGTGAEIRIQDQRGLYPLNAPERYSLQRLLANLGVPGPDADAMFDVLMDYQDTDSLKRLNGAESADYEKLGLPPPRNDWLLAIGELSAMPVWRDRPQVIAALEQLASTNRVGFLNPNTATPELLRAMLPAAKPEQIARLIDLRAVRPFTSGAAAQAATGLALDRDDYFFWGGEQYRVTVWAPGLPLALQYNVTLSPGGPKSPWAIAEVRPAAATPPNPATDRATAFPLAIKTPGP